MRREVAWLQAELPQLVERGVLTTDAAEALRRHYASSGSEPAASRAGWGQILLACFGALLVGGGIILILAHNWDGLGRPARAGIALGVLLAVQALTLFAVARRPGSTAWRESTSGLLVAAVGASIALVGQTYHAGGSVESLMRAWLWLVVLVPYLTGSSLASIGFWALLVVRAFGLTWHDSPWDPWLLVLAGFPFVVLRLRTAAESWATALVMMAAVTSIFIIGTAVTVDSGWNGLWAVFDVSFLAAIVAAASWPPGAYASEMWRRRILVPASLALIAMGTILSFGDAWRDVLIGDRHFRNPNVAMGALVAVASVATASILMMRLVRAGRMAAAVSASAAPLVVVLHVLAMFELSDAGWVAFNVWLLVLGVVTLVEGVRTLELGAANRGLLTLAALVIARFFDTDVSFLARGLAFVAFGIGCLALNVWLMRRARRSTP